MYKPRGGGAPSTGSGRRPPQHRCNPSKNSKGSRSGGARNPGGKMPPRQVTNFGTGPTIAAAPAGGRSPREQVTSMDIEVLNTKQLYKYWTISATLSMILLVLTFIFDWNKFYVYYDGERQTIDLGLNAAQDFDNDNVGMRVFTTIWCMIWAGVGMYGLYEADWKYVGAGALNSFICTVFFFIVVFLDFTDTLSIILEECEELREAVASQGVTFSCDYTFHVVITLVDILTLFATLSATKLAQRKTFSYRATAMTTAASARR